MTLNGSSPMNANDAPTPLALALLTPSQMAVADQATIAAGTDIGTLMEAAGAAVAVAVGVRWTMRPVTVLCGPGNNGGDGFVAARHLAAAGWPVKLALLGLRDKLSGAAAEAASQWKASTAPASSSTRCSARAFRVPWAARRWSWSRP
jgi:NAD(P)H-hydrate epimerase